MLKIPIRADWRNKPLEILIQSDIHTEKKPDTYNLVVATNDSIGQPVRYHYFNLRWYEDENHGDFKLNYPYTAKYFSPQELQLIIYIWNREKRKTHLENTRIQINTLN